MLQPRVTHWLCILKSAASPPLRCIKAACFSPATTKATTTILNHASVAASWCQSVMCRVAWLPLPLASSSRLQKTTPRAKRNMSTRLKHKYSIKVVFYLAWTTHARTSKKARASCWSKGSSTPSAVGQSACTLPSPRRAPPSPTISYTSCVATSQAQ